MNNKIIAVEITGEHIIKGIGGNGYVVDHNHLYIRVQSNDTYNWTTLGFCFPKTEKGRLQAIKHALLISAENGNVTVFENGYGIK